MLRTLAALLALGLLAACPKPTDNNDANLPPALRADADPLTLPLTRTDALPFVLPAQYGQPLILHLFTTWCYPCIPEVEELVQRYEELRAAGIKVVGISLDLEGIKTLPAFISTFSVPYPLAAAGPELMQGTTPLGPIQNVPALFLLDRRGVVVGYRVGTGGSGWLDQTIAKAKTLR